MMTKKELDLNILLPHRSPMLLLDRALDYGEDFAKAELYIHPESYFYDAGMKGVPAWVGIEYMAQTMGIWSGSQQLLRQWPVQIGFLLGSRCYQCNQSVFKSGVHLLIECKVLFCGEDGVGAFECVINSIDENNEMKNDSKGTILATARINAFLPDDSSEFLKKQITA